MSVPKDPRGVPDTIGTQPHIIPVSGLPGMYVVPVSRRLPPAMDAVDRRVDQRLIWPALGNHLGGHESPRQVSNPRSAILPVMMALDTDLSLVVGMTTCLLHEDRVF